MNAPNQEPTVLAKVIAVEATYNPPLGGVGVYMVSVTLPNRGNAMFSQQFVVPPVAGQLWEMPEPQLELLKYHPDGSPR